jgi:uncharacterized protein YbjT (DUF2867 family)
VSTVLVCGATGTVGSRVVHELRARGAATRVFVRDREKALTLLPGDIDLAIGDFADPHSIRAALNGVDRVFLGCANDPRPMEYESNVLDVAVAAGGRRVVKLPAAGAQVGSPLEFWDWHGRIEQRLRESGLPAVLLQARCAAAPAWPRLVTGAASSTSSSGVPARTRCPPRPRRARPASSAARAPTAGSSPP